MSNYKIPMRMCVACRQMFPKKDMIRVSRNQDGNISIDVTGKAEGRGAYVCNSKECIAKCTKSKLFNRSFKTNVNGDIYTGLSNE